MLPVTVTASHSVVSPWVVGKNNIVVVDEEKDVADNW
jgi:uncharacterized protein YaiI (UPF0178 family)